MRLFVAVTPGEQFKRELTLRLDHLRRKWQLAWVPPENWHMTLQFLGRWPEDRTTGLSEALRAAAGCTGFHLGTGRLDAFPSRPVPRALFLQIIGGEPLGDLATGIRENVNSAWPDGPQDNRPFRAHLTVARVKKGQGREDFSPLWDMDLSDLPIWPVHGFGLFVSEFHPDGVRYREQGFYPLRKKGE